MNTSGRKGSVFEWAQREIREGTRDQGMDAEGAKGCLEANAEAEILVPVPVAVQDMVEEGAVAAEKEDRDRVVIA